MHFMNIVQPVHLCTSGRMTERLMNVNEHQRPLVSLLGVAPEKSGTTESQGNAGRVTSDRDHNSGPVAQTANLDRLIQGAGREYL